MLDKPPCDCDQLACRATQRLWPSFENAKRTMAYCPYCGAGFDGSIVPTRDHIVPVSRNGCGSAWNLVRVCQRCNTHKGNKLLIEWLWDLERVGDARSQWVRRFLKCRKRSRVLAAMREILQPSSQQRTP